MKGSIVTLLHLLFDHPWPRWVEVTALVALWVIWFLR